MSISRVKTWSSGEVLTASDLNAEFNNLINNPVALWSPAGQAADMNGFELILDGDADTSITADTDDRIDVRLGGVDLFVFNGTVASPVNGITCTASATGTMPRIAATGDTNIGLELRPKGTGKVTLTDGTDVTKKIDFDLSSVGSGTTRTLTIGNAGFAIGAPTQAEMEGAETNAVPVTPGRQHYHPSAAKVWCVALTNGTISASYNMTSVTDTGTGDITFTIATDFSSANWVAYIGGTVTLAGGAPVADPYFGTQNVAFAAGSVNGRTLTISTGAAVDPSTWFFSGFGDQ